jgi:hypothetical protein
MFLFFHDSTCAMCTFPSSTNNFAHAQMLSRMSSLSGRMNIARINIECFTGCKRIKQRHISFILGYLCMILWKISTTINIKHRILATFNIKKNSVLTLRIYFHNLSVKRSFLQSKTWNFPYRPSYQPSTHISPPASLSGLIWESQADTRADMENAM